MRDDDEIAVLLAIALGGAMYMDEINNWPRAIVWLRDGLNQPFYATGEVNQELADCLTSPASPAPRAAPSGRR